MTPHDLEQKMQHDILHKLKQADKMLLDAASMKAWEKVDNNIKDYVFLAQIYLTDMQDRLKKYFARNNEQE